MSIPRHCSVQTQRNNHPGPTAKVFWRRSVFSPFSNQLISQLQAHFNHLTVTAVSGLLLCSRNPSNKMVIQERIFNEAFGKNLPTVVRILVCTGKNLRGLQLTWLSSSYHCLGDTVSCRTQCTISYYFLCWLCSMKPLGKDLPAVDSLSQEIDRWVRNGGMVTIKHFQRLSQTYNATEKGLYCNISCLFHLLLVAPVTSASVE